MIGSRDSGTSDDEVLARLLASTPTAPPSKPALAPPPDLRYLADRLLFDNRDVFGLHFLIPSSRKSSPMSPRQYAAYTI